jgi:hypothetical protein
MQTRTIRPEQSPCLDHSVCQQARFRFLLAHRRSGPLSLVVPQATSDHGAASESARPVPNPKRSPSRRGLPYQCQTVLAKDPALAQDLPEFDRPRSAEILTSTSTGAHNKPWAPRPGARQAHRPAGGSSAALTPPQAYIEPQLRSFSLLASGSCLIAQLDASLPARPQDPARTRPVFLGPTTRPSRPAGGAGPLIGHPTALRWGYHGVQVPRAVLSVLKSHFARTCIGNCK